MKQSLTTLNLNMKNNFLLLFCFFSFSILQAQIVDLQKLSKGRLYFSDVIKDENNNLRGYFLLFETDKIAKETYQLEYVVLDENLTKVTNGFMTEMKYESWLLKAEKISVRVAIFKDKLLLQFADYYEGDEYYKRYRLLSLKDNQLSKPFIFSKGKMLVDPVFDRKNTNMINNFSENIVVYEGVGLMVDSKTLYKKMPEFSKSYLVHMDSDFKEIWRYNYSDINDKVLNNLKYVNSDEDLIVMYNHAYKGWMAPIYLNKVSILFLESKTGVLRNEFEFPELEKYGYRVVDCKITSDKVYLYGNYSETNKKGFIKDTDNLGLFNFVFDKKTGKLTKSHYLKWESLSDKLPIDKKGYVKKEGYLYPHEMLLTDEGKIILVAEAFIQSPITTNNLYFFEMNNNLDVNQVFTVEKFRNKFPKTSGHSSSIKKYGLFDFIDYQDLGDNEFLFLFSDNEKKSKNRNKSTLYGIVSYSEGKFKKQTLELKTETSTVNAYNAKKGYIMLVENFDEKNKATELRLEKINY